MKQPVDEEKAPHAEEETDSQPAETLTRACYDLLEVAFDGYQDPMCPRSMSLVRKWIIVIIVCMGSLCVSTYTTTYPQLTTAFATLPLLQSLGFSSFVLGIASGPLLTSPLSESYGRRPIYLRRKMPGRW